MSCLHDAVDDDDREYICKEINHCVAGGINHREYKVQNKHDA